MPTKPKYDIQIEDNRRGETYSIGIELAASQLRVAALAKGTTPSLKTADPLSRAGFYAVAYHAWKFEPARVGARFEVSDPDIETVVAVVKDFLKDRDIPIARIDRVQVGVIIAFDQEAIAVAVDTGALRGRLAAELGRNSIAGVNRVQAALAAERRFGAGIEIRPAPTLMYITVSHNLNLDRTGNTAPDGIFGRGVRHSLVDLTEVERVGKVVVDDTFVTTAPRTKCKACEKDVCLHNIAAGQGILDIVVGEFKARGQAIGDSAIAGIVRGRPTNGPTSQANQRPRFVSDRGAHALVDGVQVDTEAVFRAAAYDQTCKRVVHQAGVAIGMALVDHFYRPGTFEPQLIVLGGTVSAGTTEDDQQALSARTGIDGVIQRTILYLLPQERYRDIKVTRSRFAGFTGLLGLTISPDEIADEDAEA